MTEHAFDGSPGWQPYDPTWLVELAQASAPLDAGWLPESLARATRAAFPGCPAMIYFVDPRHPNEPGSAWQFKHNIVLESVDHGDVVLSVLEGQRIGAAELLERIGECPDHYG